MVYLKRPVHLTYFVQSDGYGSNTFANRHGRGRRQTGFSVGAIEVVGVGVGVVEVTGVVVVVIEVVVDAVVVDVTCVVVVEATVVVVNLGMQSGHFTKNDGTHSLTLKS
jgi:hypothetical protein